MMMMNRLFKFLRKLIKIDKRIKLIINKKNLGAGQSGKSK